MTVADVDGRAGDRLIAGLVGVARRLNRRADDPVVLSRRADDPVVRAADVVVKAHPGDAEARGLGGRLRVAELDVLDEALVSPLRRLVSAWPAGEPVDSNDPDAAPWEPVARLLARQPLLAQSPNLKVRLKY